MKTMTIFETLIEELGHILEISLKAEQEIFCKINAGDIIQVQLEHRDDKISIVSFLTEIPPGTFREEVLIQALKYNNNEDTQEIFSYISNQASLALELDLPETIPAGDLSDHLKRFVEIGKTWKEAIDSGDLNSISKPATSSLISPMNLKP
jgi:hypothetical protein